MDIVYSPEAWPTAGHAKTGQLGSVGPDHTTYRARKGSVGLMMRSGDGETSGLSSYPASVGFVSGVALQRWNHLLTALDYLTEQDSVESKSSILFLIISKLDLQLHPKLHHKLHPEVHSPASLECILHLLHNGYRRCSATSDCPLAHADSAWICKYPCRQVPICA